MAPVPPRLTIIACETRTSGAATINTWEGVTLTPYGIAIDRSGDLYYRAFPKSDAGAYDNYRRNITVISNIVHTPSAWICSCIGHFEDSTSAYMLWKPAELDTLDEYWGKVVNPGKRGKVTTTGGSGEDGHGSEDALWIVKGLRLLVEIACVIQALHDQSILLVIARPSFFRVEKGLSDRGGPAIRLMDMSTCEYLQSNPGRRDSDPQGSGELVRIGLGERKMSKLAEEGEGDTPSLLAIRPGLRDRRRSTQPLDQTTSFGLAAASRPDGRTRSFTEAVSGGGGDGSGVGQRDYVNKEAEDGNGNGSSGAMAEDDIKRESRRKLSRSASRDDILIRHHLRYLAPENTATKAPPTVLSDMYSMGVCMYELLAEQVIEGEDDRETRDILSDIYRHLTFEIPSLSSINDAVSREVSDMVNKCISRNPIERYVSFASLRYDLKRMIGKALDGGGLEGLHGFEPAKVDKMARYEWLTDMQDRQEEMPVLKAIFERTRRTGEAGLAIVYGESGCGKSMLLEKSVAANSDSGPGPPSLVGWAKLDEHLVRPLSAFTQIFKSLLDAVLTDPLEDVAKWRENILATLDRPYEMFASMIPREWQDLLLKGTTLEPKIGSHAAETVTDYDVYVRQLRSWSRTLLQMFADARSSVMILVLDDVQWMSREERELWVDLLENPSCSLRNTVAFGSYRTGSPDEIPAFSSAVRLVSINSFSLATIQAQLQSAFKWPAGDSRLIELAGILFRETQGNPLHLKLLLPILVKQRGVYFDFEAENLTWQVHLGNAAVHALSGLESIIQDIILALPIGTQDSLKTLACLPGRDVPLSLLATLLSRTVKTVTSDLQTAAAIGLVTMTTTHVNFCHDKQHSAALKVLKREPDAARQRLDLARTLVSIDPSDIYVYDVVNNMMAARDMGCRLDVIEAVELLLRAGRKANRAGSFGAAIGHVQRIEELMPIIDRASWERYRPLCFAKLNVWTDAAQGHKVIAADVVLKLRRGRTFCVTTLEHLRLLLLEVRLTLTLALFTAVPALVHEAFGLAGLSTDPGDPAVAPLLALLPDTAEGLRRYSNKTKSDALPAETDEDRIAILLSILTTLAGPSCFTTTEDQGYSIFTVCCSLSFRSQRVMNHAGSAYILAIMGLLMCGQLKLDKSTAFMQLATEDKTCRDPAFDTLVDVVVSTVAHINTPTRQITYTRSWVDAMAAGNSEVAPYAASLDLMVRYVSGYNLVASAQVGRTRLAALVKQAAPPAYVALAAVLQMLDNLSDKERPLAALAILEGPQLSLADGALTEPFGLCALLYYTSALICGMVFETDYSQLVAIAKKAREFANGAPGTLTKLEYAFTYALFTLSYPEKDDPAYRAELLDEMRAFTDSPDTRVRVAMIEGLELAVAYRPDSGPHWSDICEKYDSAYAEAMSIDCITVAGYIAYLTARFIFAIKPTSHMATGYVVAAANAYRRSGSFAVLRKLQAEFPDLASLSTGPSKAMEPSASSPPKADLDTRLGLESIVRSFLVLATERDGEALLSKLLKVLLQLSRAEFCAIVLRGDVSGKDGFLLRAAGTYASLAMFDIPLADAAAYCPVAPILHCVHTKNVISDSAELVRWKKERFYRGVLPEWILTLPLLIQGELGGILYLDSRTARDSSFHNHSNEIVSMLATFAAISHESLSTTRSLEEAVERRTAQLQEALAAKSTFLSHMSHELRTPLFAVLGLTAVLEDSKGLDQTQREYLSTIRSSGEDLRRVIDSVLDHSKLESGSIETEEIVFDLRSVGESVTESLAAVAHGKGVYLYVLTPMDNDPLNKLIGDPYRIRQCLLNLVGNAIKFTEPGGKVTVGWDLVEKGSRVQIGIEVTDNGCGVPPDKTDRLFKSYSQVDSSIQRTAGGTGLGLAITKSLAKLMGGDCIFRPALGRGSVFRLTLDVGKSEETTGHVVRRGGKRVHRMALVASSDPWQDVLIANLKSIGIECCVTSPHRGAVWTELEKVVVDAFDFIVLDDVPLSDDDFAHLSKKYSHAEIVLITVRRSSDKNINSTKVLVKPVKAVALCQVFVSEKDSRGGIAEPDAKPANTAMDKTLASRMPLRVLYVDDNRVNCMVGTKILQRFGYKDVQVRYNGLEAVNTWTQQRFDLILLDLQMPVMDGFTAMAEIQKRSGEKGSPVPLTVALTAHSDLATKEKCAEQGFWDFLAKPLDIGSLKQVLEKAHETLEGRKTEKET